MNTKLALLAGITIVALAFGSVGIAAAQTGGPGTDPRTRRGARVYGVIEAIAGETLTLATPVGPVAVVTDANTIFRIPGVEDPGLDDLVTGDYLGAAGWWEEGNTFHAFGVARVETDRVLPVAGKLSAIGADTLTVETGHGPATVGVDDETVYRIPDVEDPGPDDLEVGMRIVARGTLNPDGSLLAQVVTVPQPGPRQGHLRGEVLAIERDTFTVRTARGRQLGREIQVLTDETTEFRVPGVENPSIADLQVGDKITGEGVREEDGTVRATLVVVLPEQVARLDGEVAAVEGTILVLETLGGTVNVLTDAGTVFRVPGMEEPTLADVEIGDRVIAAGTWEDEATFSAIGVSVRGGRRPGQPGVVRGRAISVGTESLVLGTLHGPVTMLVDDETEYRVPGVEDPGLDDIEAGDPVSARGTWNEDGTLQATGVGVLGGE
ncbi:MAG: hypothetical protein ISS49_08200 [Anaerolineae bacterium]|nr:hypothetical protein [Anaerolineae bacterium]